MVSPMALPHERCVEEPHAHGFAKTAPLTGSRTADVRPAGVELVVGLQLRHASAVQLERVPEVLGSDASGWLGEEIADARLGMRSYLCDLELQAGGHGPTLFRKAAVVSLADPARTPEGWVAEVEWRAASLSPLFPVFAGRLTFDAEGIGLDGRYAPPGGRLGYVLDVTVLGAAARQTGRWFLRHLADGLA